MEFDREEKQAYALEVEARDGAASARPNANGRPNTGKDVSIFFTLAKEPHDEEAAYLPRRSVVVEQGKLGCF